MEKIEKFRKMAGRLMISLGTLLCVIDVFTLLFGAEGSYVDYWGTITSTLCIFSVILGIFVFALSLAHAGVSFVRKTNMALAFGTVIPAIGCFVTALIMTNFTSVVSHDKYLIREMEKVSAYIKNRDELEHHLENCVAVPIILSAVFAAVVVVISIIGKIKEKNAEKARHN